MPFAKMAVKMAVIGMASSIGAIHAAWQYKYSIAYVLATMYTPSHVLCGVSFRVRINMRHNTDVE